MGALKPANGVVSQAFGNKARVQAAVVAALIDGTGGTVNDILENLADGTTYANDHAKIENNFADLAAKVNAILTALKDAGIMASS